MSNKKEEDYFSNFFKFINEIIEEKRPYDELFKEYKINEVIDIIGHSASTIFLTLSRMDVEMDFMSNLLNLIWVVRNGTKPYDALNDMIKKYNTLTKSVVVELYNNLNQISKMGLEEKSSKMLKDLIKDIKEIVTKRGDFTEDFTD